MIAKRLILLAALLPATACELDVGDLNNVPESELVNNPTPALVRAAATGLIIGNRAGYAENNGYILHLGILGREAYNLDPADPRFASEMLGGPLNGGSPAFGGNFWNAPYTNIHNANNLLKALDKLDSPELSMGQVEWLRGFTKTFQALDYLVVINTRDTNGAAVPTGDEGIDGLPPLKSKEEVFAHIKTLLDEGQAHLQAAGNIEPPIALPSGFDDVDGIDTPFTFVHFNRALKARVDAYTGDYTAALESLAASFLTMNSEDPQLEVGVYHAYSILPGDAQNELITRSIYAHPSVATDTQGGDERAELKVNVVEPRSLADLTSNLRFNIYKESDSPVPIIRNEELILLHAEASFNLGSLDDAIVDINFVREHSAGLAPRNDLTEANFVDELLYQRRYGLMFEGHRWIDLRRFGRLEELPLDRPGDVVNAAFPIPTPELDARDPDNQ